MLGVCYYPEHWPEKIWQQDAQEMSQLGLKYVRIGEFAWSKIEPEEGKFDFAWLDKAISVLAEQGLEVIMCTPTATPPKWLIDKHPDILPVDIHTGITRGFGSRRHYDFSSENYFKHAMRISEVVAKRYGQHPNVCGWQTDNEIACHDTTHSGSVVAKHAFQDWCQQQYGDIERLNSAWGNVFWSMEYQAFSDIELPILAVTETNPAHQLAYRRFSSDQVVRFHDHMIAIIRKHSPNRFVTHNFIPLVDTQTDNFALAKNLDFVSYDNYPLGRSDMFFKHMPAEQYKPYMRTGHPDFSSYSFDQSRGISQGNFWVMEQQPGPVNWAHYNPRPEKGMVRLWSWQAFAHGADCVCYFRWRQVPFAQEQMHAGIKRNDNSKSVAWDEIAQMRDELKAIKFSTQAVTAAKVAIVTGAESQWVTEIERQGDSYNHQQVEFRYYTALRQLGLAVDFISVNDDITPYTLLVAPCLPIVTSEFVKKCQTSAVACVFGPRSGAKTAELSLVDNLGPGLLQQLIPIKVLSTETIRPDCSEPMTYKKQTFESQCWREEIALGQGVSIEAVYHDGLPAIARHGRFSYIATITCEALLTSYFTDLCQSLSIAVTELPQDVRMVERGEYVFFFNYSANSKQLPHHLTGEYLLGSDILAPFDVAILKQT